MRAELSRMNKELDNVEVGSDRFKQLTVDSKKLRDEIKGADEATGRFQANVETTKGAIIDAFQQMGIPVSKSEQGFKLAQSGNEDSNRRDWWAEYCNEDTPCRSD